MRLREIFALDDADTAATAAAEYAEAANKAAVAFRRFSDDVYSASEVAAAIAFDAKRNANAFAIKHTKWKNAIQFPQYNPAIQHGGVDATTVAADCAYAAEYSIAVSNIADEYVSAATDIAHVADRASQVSRWILRYFQV